jgi:hypothetical protein
LDVPAAHLQRSRADRGLRHRRAIFISSGDHDLTANIVHLVLARVGGAPAGTKGLTLFIIPRRRVDQDGNPLGSNDVSVGAIEHKMGINGSATCVLNFGENGNCIGVPVGGEGKLNYAKDRKQGSSIERWKDANAPRVSIIEHADVRRMLIDMKARVEGIRALAVKLAHHQDQARLMAAPDAPAIIRSSSIAAMQRYSRSMKERTTSRRWTWWGARSRTIACDDLVTPLLQGRGPIVSAGFLSAVGRPGRRRALEVGFLVDLRAEHIAIDPGIELLRAA